MPRGNVLLNAKGYVTTPRKVSGLDVDVEEYTVEAFGEVIKTEGATQLSDLKNRDAKVWTGLTGGFGRNRIPADAAADPAEYKRFWDSTCETRFGADVRAAIADADSTETGLEVIRAGAEYKANMWGLWEDDADVGLVARKYTGSTTSWGGGGTIRGYAPAYQSVSTGTATATNSKTLAHTTPAGQYRCLIVAVSASNNSSATSLPSGITYGGNAMTAVGSAVLERTVGALNVGVALYYYVAPAVGAANVVVSFANNQDYIVVGAMSFQWVDQTTPTANGAGQNGSATSSSNTVTSVADQIAVDVINVYGNETLVVGANQTERWNTIVGAAMAGAGSTETATGTTTAMSWSWTGTVGYAHAACTLQGTSPAVGLDIMPHKTHLLALYAHEDDHIVARSTDGITWTPATTQPTAALLSNSATANEDEPFGLIAEIGGEAVAILWHESNGTITFFSSTDAGAIWADEAVDIASQSGPLGVAIYPGVDNEDKLYVLTKEGLYQVDTAPATWTIEKVVSFSSTTNTSFSRRLAVHADGLLWIAANADNNSPCPVYTLNTSGGVRDIRYNLGLDTGDGIPTGLLGQIRWLISAGGFLFASVGGGAASRNGRVICWNGEGWHHMHQHATANQDIEWIAVSDRDDGNTRLHFAARTATATSDSKYLPEPVVNPQSGASILRESTGIIDLPYIDGGMPTFNKTWLQYRVDADDLGTTSQEKITVTDGTNGAARTTNARGEFISGTTELTVASGAGVASKNVGARLAFAQRAGGTTQTAKMRSLELVYLPQPDVLEGYIFNVDLGATATLQQTTPENVLTDLKAARDLTTLPTFSYGKSGTKYVKVRRVRELFALKQGSGSGAMVAGDTVAQRFGYAEVTCEEVI